MNTEPTRPQKNNGICVFTHTYDCPCGLKAEKACPKAVALLKRLHLKKCKVGQEYYADLEARGVKAIYKYEHTKYSGKSMVVNKGESTNHAMWDNVLIEDKKFR